jgi:N-acetylglucosaminyl-diphospho-decaprenol L-rhamnosyltransferase
MKKLSDHNIVLSILIVNWNTRQDLLRCLGSIKANPPSCPFEVVVFDNASADGSVEAVAAQYPQVRLEASHENLGFARANNRVASSAQGIYWLLLNPDTVVHPHAVDALVNYLSEHPRVAAVGPRLINSDGSLQLSIERLPSLFREWWRLFHLDRLYPISLYTKDVLASQVPQRVEVLKGACLLLRADIVRPLGLFDEDYFVYSEETDLCDRLGKAGWDLHWLPAAVVTHSGGRSTSQVADRMFLELYRNKIKFFRKRRSALAGTIYKIVLFQASLARFGLGQAIQVLPFSGRHAWADVARQYRLLLAALPSL